MYFEQECIKKDVGVSVATGRDARIQWSHTWRMEFYFVLSFPCQTFFFSYGLVLLFCFFFLFLMIFGIFATCKIEGGANHVNVKTFYNYWKCNYLFIYVFIYLFCDAFMEVSSSFCHEMQKRGGWKATFRISWQNKKVPREKNWKTILLL